MSRKSKDDSADRKADRNSKVEKRGHSYYSLVQTSELNPCAGKTNGTSCGPGCNCVNGQCFYTEFRLKKMGIVLDG